MKILSKAAVVKRKQVEHTITERRVLGYTRHPFIIQLHYAFQTRDKLFLVVDYAAGGELFFHLGRLGKFRESMTQFYAAELVLALGHLHRLGIAYRDLKPENVLLDASGHVKLADFGLSKEGITASTEGTRSFCGTPEYLAPEVLNRTGHGTAVDWWSLGSLIYEMLTSLPPWYTRDRKKLYERLRSAPLEFPDIVSPVARSIISGLLTRDPTARLGAHRDAAELMEHPFFAGVDWRALYARRVTPPFVPQLRGGESDTRYFDAQFTDLPPNTTLDDEKASPPNPAAVAAALASAPAAGGVPGAHAGSGGGAGGAGGGGEEGGEAASLTNGLFHNFTFDGGPSLLGVRSSRGASLSFSGGLGSFSESPTALGRDGMPLGSPAASGAGSGSGGGSGGGGGGGGGGGVKRVPSGLVPAGASSAVALVPTARSLSNEIAAGMASARAAAATARYTPSSNPGGLTEMLRGVASGLGGSSGGGGGGGGMSARGLPHTASAPVMSAHGGHAGYGSYTAVAHGGPGIPHGPAPSPRGAGATGGMAPTPAPAAAPPPGPSRPVAVHGASSSFRMPPPTGPLPVSPLSAVALPALVTGGGGGGSGYGMPGGGGGGGIPVPTARVLHVERSVPSYGGYSSGMPLPAMGLTSVPGGYGSALPVPVPGRPAPPMPVRPYTSGSAGYVGVPPPAAAKSGMRR